MNKKYYASEWKERIEEAIKNTSSMTQAYNYLNLERKTFKRMAIELGLWDSNKAENFSHKKIPLEDILSKKYKFRQSNLKFRLLEEGYKEYKCENCNLSVWLDKKVPIPLELHHINGDHEDNSYENLQLLCPNCHALTENYRAKNIKKK